MVNVIIFSIMLFFSLPAATAHSQEESAAITATALNYMEGWYQGDARRMKASLHKKLAKTGEKWVIVNTLYEKND